MMVHSDTEVFPLLQLPRGELYSEVGHCTQAAVALWSQGILGDVKLLQGFCSLNLLHLDIHDVVVVGVDGLNLGQPEHHRGEVHIGVVTEVEALQLHTVCQLLRQLGHLVVGYIQLCYKTKLEGELGRDLGQQVPGEVARGERGVSHQVEDSVRHLTQLALTQVETVVFFGVIASVDHLDDRPSCHTGLHHLRLSQDNICQVVSKLGLHFVYLQYLAITDEQYFHTTILL